MAFDLIGHTPSGAPMFRSDCQQPPLAEWLVVFLLGTLVTIGLLIGGILNLLNGDLLVGAFALICVASLTAGVVRGSVWWIQIWKRVQSWLSLDEIASRRGLGTAETRSALQLEGRNLQAKVNECEMYEREADPYNQLLIPVVNTQLVRPSEPCEGLVRPVNIS